jgi:hypothetical protein
MASYPRTSTKAVLSLVFGLLGLIGSLLFSILGIVLGHLALGDIRKRPAELGGSGMATGGLVAGYIGLAFWGLVLLAVGSMVAVSAATGGTARAGAVRSAPVAIVAPSAGYLDFDDTAHGVKVFYPNDWMKVAGKDKDFVGFFVADDGSNVLLSTERMGVMNPTLDQYADLNLKNVKKKYPKAEFEGPTRTTLGGLPARSMVLRREQDDEPTTMYKQWLILALRNGKGYLSIYSV